MSMKESQGIIPMLAFVADPIEHSKTVAALPRHSFREDGRIPELKTKLGGGIYPLTYLIDLDRGRSRNLGADPEIKYKIEDSIRRRLAGSRISSSSAIEFIIETELRPEIGMNYSLVAIQQALNQIIKSDFEVHYAAEAEDRSLYMREACSWFLTDCLVSYNKDENGNSETYIGGVVTDLYSNMLRHSDLNPFERRMMGNFPAISRRWYEVIRFWRSFRSETRNEVSINYSELCDWMPIDRKRSEREMMGQMNVIHKPFVECGFIKDFEATPKLYKKGIDWILRYNL